MRGKGEGFFFLERAQLVVHVGWKVQSLKFVISQLGHRRCQDMPLWFAFSEQFQQTAAHSYQRRLSQLTKLIWCRMLQNFSLSSSESILSLRFNLVQHTHTQRYTWCTVRWQCAMSHLSLNPAQPHRTPHPSLPLYSTASAPATSRPNIRSELLRGRRPEKNPPRGQMRWHKYIHKDVWGPPRRSPAWLSEFSSKILAGSRRLAAVVLTMPGFQRAGRPAHTHTHSVVLSLNSQWNPRRFLKYSKRWSLCSMVRVCSVPPFPSIDYCVCYCLGFCIRKCFAQTQSYLPTGKQ